MLIPESYKVQNFRKLISLSEAFEKLHVLLIGLRDETALLLRQLTQLSYLNGGHSSERTAPIYKKDSWKFIDETMEITDNLEIRLVVTARKIRMFNENIAKLKELDALVNIPESERVRDELEREFQWLSAHIWAVEVVA